MILAERLVFRRVLSAITWIVAFEVLAACTFLIFLHISFWNPVTWIIDVVSIQFSPKTWLFFTPVITFTAGFGFLLGAELASVSARIPNRISLVRRTVSIHNGMLMLTLTMLSLFLCWFYVSAWNGQYTSISSSCPDSSGNCVVEGKLYLVLGSMFVGVYMFVTDFTFQTNCLRYSVAQQLKLIHIKEELFNIFNASFRRSLWPVTLFTFLYMVVGRTIRDHLTELLSLKVATETSSDITGLIFVFYMFIMTVVYVFIITTAKYLINLHLTERHVFPIVSSDGSSEKLKLADAMKMQGVPVVLNLAYLDLKLLAEKDLARRHQFYVLSHPGGHPYNWNGIVSECFNIIISYTSSVNSGCLEMVGESSTKGSQVQENEAPLPSFPKNDHTSMRNLSLTTAISDSVVKETFSPVVSCLSFSDLLKTYWNEIVKYFYKNPIISYFFGVIPESRLHWVLSKAHPVIWATQGIAFITTASFKEDDFGICLRDLPAIITALVNLNTAVKKIPKFATQKRAKKIETMSMKMKYALEDAVERSLYKIIITYGAHLRDIRLPSEIFQELQTFKTVLEE